MIDLVFNSFTLINPEPVGEVWYTLKIDKDLTVKDIINSILEYSSKNDKWGFINFCIGKMEYCIGYGYGKIREYARTNNDFLLNNEEAMNKQISVGQVLIDKSQMTYYLGQRWEQI